MSAVLVLVEYAGGSVTSRDRELIAFGAGVGEPVPLAVGPHELLPDGESSWPAPVARVLAVPCSAAPAAPALADALVAGVRHLLGAGESVAAVLVAADCVGREVAGRLAVLLEAGVVADVVAAGVSGGVVVATTRPLGGTWEVTVAVPDGLAVLAVAPGGHAATPGGDVAVVRVETLQPGPASAPSPVVVQRRAKAVTARPDLGEAAVVVAAGRGTDGDLSAVEELADELGGAVGVSRVVVESGWADRDLQVGQTGRQVSPTLYVAAGISGAIQHRSGMQSSQRIVAVNTDPEAPIFELADIGVVGDLFAVLPALTAEIRRRRAGAER